MKRAILHIGTHKTGTTAVQTLFYDNAKAFMERGICFPKPKAKYRAVAGWRNAHFLTRHAIDLVDPDATPDKVRAANAKNLANLARAVERFDTVVLSDEALWFESAQRPAMWTAIKTTLEEAGIDEFLVVVYLRRQDQFIASLWNQRVKNVIRLTVSMERYVKRKASARAMDYEAVLAEIENVFGREAMRVGVYDRAQLENGDIRNDFCTVAGIDASAELAEADTDANPGLTDNVAEIKRQANFSKSYKATDNFLQNAAIAVSMMPDAASDTSMLSPELRRTIIEQHAESNSRVARRYLGREDGVLFAAPSRYPDLWQLDHDTFSRDIVRFFTEALTAEHVKRRDAEARIKELEGRVGELEGRMKALESRGGGRPPALHRQIRAALRRVRTKS